MTHDDGFKRYQDLVKYLDAAAFIQEMGIPLEDVIAERNTLIAVRDWIVAENQYLGNVSKWLIAEDEWNRHLRVERPLYEAAERGWNQVKTYVPNLDGYPSFSDLPKSLQFRYAVFAAGVLGIEEELQEVQSNKQYCRSMYGS